jgi:radical SAM superfamily enzyme YgiQ (UPF0313 family)
MFDGQGRKRILLIEPPFYNLFGYKRYHYPITLVAIATYLKELGHEVRVLDADRPDPECREYNRSEAGDNYFKYFQALSRKDHFVFATIADTLSDFQPDVVGVAQSISAKVDSADLVARMAREILGPGAEVMTGGAHVASMRRMDRQHNFGKLYDRVITHIPGLIDRKPDKSLLIDLHEYDPKDLASIMSSAGCPYKCTFCNCSMNSDVLFRNLPSIAAELDEIATCGKDVYFVDDNFLMHKRRFFELAEMLRKRQLNYKAGARVNDLSMDRIDRFIASGGEKIYLGLESGSDRILQLIKKRLTVEEIKRKTRWINQAGLSWSAFFIVGFPFETLDDLKRTRELIEETEPTFASLNRFTPYPGTKIWMDHYKDCRIEFKHLFQLNRFVRSNLSDEIEEFIEDMFVFVDDYGQKKKLAARVKKAG